MILNNLVLTELGSAILYNDINVVEDLLKNGANPNGCCFTNEHCFSCVLSHAYIFEKYEVFDLLLRYGANINNREDPPIWLIRNITPNKHFKFLLFMYQRKADFIVFNARGQTPLDYTRPEVRFKIHKIMEAKRKWTLVKCLVLLFRLRRNAVVTANHPSRLTFNIH